MKGQVDQYGRAMLSVDIRPDAAGQATTVEVWIDTGFTGELVLSQQLIDLLKLPHSGTVDAVLADGSEIELKTYACVADWFGKQRRLEVMANDGEYPLLGVGLMVGRDLHISYRSGELTIV